MTGVNIDPSLLDEVKQAPVLVKYGGNAMIDAKAREQVFDQLSALYEMGIPLVVVHGGGPVIQSLLEEAGVPTEFSAGHRKTDETVMRYVEMALRGQVNGRIIRGLTSRGVKAVGLSGKDSKMVQVKKRIHEVEAGSERGDVDLGYVGDVTSVDTSLIRLLLKEGYLPVVAPVGTGEKDHMDYNVNADMFAGHLAGALQASAYISMTDVDGFRKDPEDPDSLLRTLKVERLKSELKPAIQGGMIPKIDSCCIALEQGVKKAHIVNGMKPDTLITKLLTHREHGTTIES